MDNMRWLPALAALISSCVNTLHYELHYEQSGGLGGVPQYRITIDSTRRCIIVSLDDSTAHRTRAQQLEEDFYRRIGSMIADTALWSLEPENAANPPRPDTPLRHLSIRLGAHTKQMVLGTPLPDALQPLVMLLDSIAQHATSMQR
ncbi:MAG: hypothetical protein N2663_03350 [Chlorobi bacterium]|nr:hypothetical protein [Chlorobiota bacterium]